MCFTKPKAERPIEVTLLGIVTVVKPVQPSKAHIPIEVTLLGIVTVVKPVQPSKAERPIEVTLLGIVTEVLVPIYAFNTVFVLSA